MSEKQRYDNETLLDNGADILLHGSDLVPVAELPQDWLIAAREAVLAASGSDKKIKPPTYAEEQAQKVASYGLIAAFRRQFVEETNGRLVQ